MSFAPVPVAQPSRPKLVPPAALAPIGAATPRPRHLSDAELTDATAHDLSADERDRLYGTRVSAGVLAGALVLAILAIVGALWWSSDKTVPVAIPAASERPVATYTIRVATEPPHATFVLDGEPRGAAPLSAELPADGQEHTLEVSAPGHITERLTFREGSVPPDTIQLRTSTDR